MYTIHWRAAVWAALGFGLLATPASASPLLVPAVVKKPHVAHAVAPHPNHAALVAALHQAHTLLATANHDYDGHRAKAAEEVSHAIHALGGQHHGHHALSTIHAAHNIAGGIANVGKVHEPQAQSDAQLKQAGQIIASVHSQVPSTHKASGHIQHALNELNTALKIR